MRRSLPLLLAVALGCGGGGYDSLAAGCEALAAAREAATERCASTYAGADEAAYVVLLEGFPAADWAGICGALDAAVQASVERGATTVDLAAFEPCVAVARASRCLDLAVIGAGLADTCPGLLAGRRTAGEACAGPWECGPDLRCEFDGGSCPGRCEGFRRKGRDEVCDGDECDPAAGLLCWQGRCQPARASGEACEGNGQCADRLCVEGRCRTSTPTEDGACGPLGASVAAWCGRGEACIPLLEGGGGCTPRSGEGGDCVLTACDLGLACDGTQCRPLPGNGEACGSGGACAPGLACGAGTCIVPYTLATDAPCATAVECASGLCLEGRCATASAAGEEILCRSALLGSP